MEKSVTNFAKANDIIIRFVLPFIIVIGTLCNIVSMAITSPKIHSSSLMMFIFMMNIFDTVGLYTEPFWLLIHRWIDNDKTELVIAYNVVLCTYNFVVICTGWITVFICFEQASKLCFNSKGLITHKKGFFLLVTTVLVSSGMNVYFFINEQKCSKEVSMMCSFQKKKMNALYEAREQRDVAYKFSWKWLDKLTACIFPVTFTLACLIAIKQGRKSLVHNNISLISSRLSSKERDTVKLVCVTGIMFILSAIPLAFFKTQVSALDSDELQFICTCLSFFVYINFAMKLVYFCTVSSFFRRNVCYLFKPDGIARQMRRLSLFKGKRSIELLPSDAHIHLEEVCSDTESNMSVSPPVGRESVTTEFSFTRVAQTALASEC